MSTDPAFTAAVDALGAGDAGTSARVGFVAKAVKPVATTAAQRSDVTSLTEVERITLRLGSFFALTVISFLTRPARF
jgi:hypothetical protein